LKIPLIEIKNITVFREQTRILRDISVCVPRLRHTAHHHTEGTGRLHQGRFKTSLIEEDDHLPTVLRDVER
jgi:hypothetical protein